MSSIATVAPSEKPKTQMRLGSKTTPVVPWFAAAQSTLRTIAKEIASEYPGADIRIDGFTDTDRITTNKYKTNYHLGFERAYSVGQFLVRQGIGRDSISYGSFGPLMPKATKDESRRVEIVVIR